MTTLRERIEAALAEMEGAKCLLIVRDDTPAVVAALADRVGLRLATIGAYDGGLNEISIMVTTDREARVIVIPDLPKREAA